MSSFLIIAPAFFLHAFIVIIGTIFGNPKSKKCYLLCSFSFISICAAAIYYL